MLRDFVAIDYPDYLFLDILTTARRQFGHSLPNHQSHTVAAACGLCWHCSIPIVRELSSLVTRTVSVLHHIHSFKTYIIAEVKGRLSGSKSPV